MKPSEISIEGIGDLESAEAGNNNNDNDTGSTTHDNRHHNDDQSYSASGSSVDNSDPLHMHNRKWVFGLLILFIGSGASAAFWSFGINSARNEQDALFQQAAQEFANAVEDAWVDYEIFGLWMHESCRAPLGASTDTSLGICSRTQFREMYEYIKSVGLQFQSAQYMPNVTHAQRPAVEEEARQYYAQRYPGVVNYQGILGIFPNAETGGVSLLPQTEQPFYFPVHYVEPLEGNAGALGIDVYSSFNQRPTIQHAVSTWQPSITNRLRLVQETDPNAYGVILHHPGIPLQERGEVAGVDKPDSISLMVIRIPDLLLRAADKQLAQSKDVYLYDASDAAEAPIFLGAVALSVRRGDLLASTLPEIRLQDISKSESLRYTERQVFIADKKLIVAVQSVGGAYQPDIVFVAFGGGVILIASLIISIWFCSHMNRIVKINNIKSQAEREKSHIIVETARKQTVAERQVNEYLAHEVRNPLSSAIAALSFVSATVHEAEIANVQTKKSLKDDIKIIDASLQFINDLLRNMLDMHRAADKQMKITMAPTDLLRDVLDPVAAILYLRGSKMQIIVDCPQSLVVMSDRLRLKQIVLNLAMNSSKFVTQGFIRLRAFTVDGLVQVTVEDSGPGLPPEKREHLFVKFQDSLDLLNQGTGIGLCLCKHLTELMHGDIWLDIDYDSGVEDHPGTKFVIDLRTKPLNIEHATMTTEESEPFIKGMSLDSQPHHQAAAGEETVVFLKDGDNQNNGDANGADRGVVIDDPKPQLPEKLSVLFVDDDMILRKLFKRSLRRVAKNWEIEEASNGETALLMVENKSFDLIFLDQYMASIEKQLLGSETARALRANGVTSKICGLSANDAESLFMEAGADTFMFKPFPCEPTALTSELIRILQCSHETQDHAQDEGMNGTAMEGEEQS